MPEKIATPCNLRSSLFLRRITRVTLYRRLRHVNLCKVTSEKMKDTRRIFVRTGAHPLAAPPTRTPHSAEGLTGACFLLQRENPASGRGSHGTFHSLSARIKDVFRLGAGEGKLPSSRSIRCYSPATSSGWGRKMIRLAHGECLA